MMYDYGNRAGWIKGMPRFWVEQRIGCIAVMDSEINRLANSPHLDGQTEGVVWFRIGKQIPSHKCPICNNACSMRWDISMDLIDQAITEANKMNDNLIPQNVKRNQVPQG